MWFCFSAGELSVEKHLLQRVVDLRDLEVNRGFLLSIDIYIFISLYHLVCITESLNNPKEVLKLYLYLV